MIEKLEKLENELLDISTDNLMTKKIRNKAKKHRKNIKKDLDNLYKKYHELKIIENKIGKKYEIWEGYEGEFSNK